MLSKNLKRLRKERKITLEALAAALGTTKQTIYKYENGIIENVPQEKIRLMAKTLGVSPAELMGFGAGREARQLPILGEIACGAPIYATEERESYVVAGENVDADFCLYARGDSMVGARIMDGDVVFIRSQATVNNGEIAAVIINDEATLKRFYYYPDEQKLILSPENPKYAPLVYMGEELSAVKVLGKAVAFTSHII